MGHLSNSERGPLRRASPSEPESPGEGVSAHRIAYPIAHLESPERRELHRVTPELLRELAQNPDKVFDLPKDLVPLRTNWIVLTGGPSSGKTTALKNLESRGWRTSSETAHEYFKEELGKGRSMDEIRADSLTLQRSILSKSLAAAAAHAENPEKVVIFDRGIPDSIGYFQHLGLDPNLPTFCSQLIQYKLAFIFEGKSVVSDGIRTETQGESLQIRELVRSAYTKVGCATLTVRFAEEGQIGSRADYVESMI
jgi:predicted ATPase